MTKTDREVLELCKSWFEDIMERCDRLTSGNVSHCSRAIHGVAKNYAEFVEEQIKTDNTWKPSNEQMEALEIAITFVTDDFGENPTLSETLRTLIEQLKKLKD